MAIQKLLYNGAMLIAPTEWSTFSSCFPVSPPQNPTFLSLVSTAYFPLDRIPDTPIDVKHPIHCVSCLQFATFRFGPHNFRHVCARWRRRHLLVWIFVGWRAAFVAKEWKHFVIVNECCLVVMPRWSVMLELRMLPFYTAMEGRRDAEERE